MKAPLPISVRCLARAVVIAGDGAGADIGAGADAGVADIGEVIGLGAGLDHGLLDLDEIADVRRPRRASRRAAAARTARPTRPCRHGRRRDARTSGSPRRPRPSRPGRTPRRARPRRRGRTWCRRQRNTVSGATRVTPASSAASRRRCCSDRFGFGELRLGVDAAHFVLLGFDRDRAAAPCRARSRPRRSDRIRPCGCRCRSAPGWRARLSPASAIRPPLQSSIARSRGLASRSSRMATSSSPDVTSRP